MVKLQPGDPFATRSKSWLGKGIRAVQWFWSSDNEATYNHVGVIKGTDGSTLEARWRFQQFSIADYIGERVLIVRHKDMTPERYWAGFEAVKDDIGCHYPVWRFALFLTHLAKFVRFGNGVCSEQTGKFMKGAGFRNIVYGLTPDDLADRWRIDKDMEIIFEGVLTEAILK
jgi:hypothetical protein